MEVLGLRVHGGMTTRGLFFLLFALTAAIFAGLGFIISYGTGAYNTSGATNVRPDTEGQTGLVQPLSATGESPFVSVVDRSYNSVVNITSTRTYRGRYQDMYDEFWRQFFGLHPREQIIPSFGSGFIISSDGLIVTNNHVVESSDEVTVTLSDKSTHKATVLGTDPATDLAVLKIETGKELDHISFGSSAQMRIGDWVVAIGNPFPSLGLDRTVTVGVVSGKGRSPMGMGSGGPTYQDYIQTDASINPGNSGGPLLNLKGEVIGVNSAIASPTGGSVGIGFAIPSDLAKPIISEIMTQGKVSRVTPDEAEMVGLDEASGVYLDEITPGSPADVGGLKRDDVVISLNGEKIADARDFRLKVAAADQGDEVKLQLLRRGRLRDVTVVLGDRESALSAITPGQRSQEPEVESSVDGLSHDWLGMQVADCTPELAERGGVAYHDGAIVVRVQQGSPADVKGIVPGTIIVEVNYESVAGKDDFERIANSLGDRSLAIAFHVFDASGRIEYVAIKPN
jgi:serine protease Do